MYSGENVIILNYSEWIIQLGLYVCYFLLLVLSTKLYIHSPSKAPNYLSYQTKKSWDSQYLTDLEIKNVNEECTSDFKQLELGQWSGITESTCLCYNDVDSDESYNSFFTTSKKSICKHDNDGNKYKDIYICSKLSEINPQNLIYYKNMKFCGKFSAKKISSYHNSITEKFSANLNVENYKSSFIQIPKDQDGIIDIKISSINLSNDGYIRKDSSNLYIKKLNKTSVNIYEYNEFITGIHYLNELICVPEEMTNINPIYNYYKNSRNVYYNNIKQCLRNKNKEYKYYYIDDNFARTSIIDINISNIINQKNDIYEENPSITNYYKKIKENKKVDILNNGNNYPILVAQKYLYGIGCQFYDNINGYFTLLKYFDQNKNISLSIIVFSLITSVTAVIFVSFNLYQNCVEYPMVYLTFCLILIISLVTDLTLSGVYLGYAGYLKHYFGKILNECRIDFSGASNSLYKNYNFNLLNYQSYNKALPIEIGLFEDLDYSFYVALFTVIDEVVILILLVIYFIFNCYRYTFISLKNESGDIIKSRRRKKKDLMDLVKMI